MSIRKVLCTLIPLALVTLAAGCDANVISDGKPLSQIDLGGTAPSELALLGPDEVRISQGDKLAITVDAAPEIRDAMRFKREGNSLAVMRVGKAGNIAGKAIVNIVMPAPKELTAAGSGIIRAETIAPEAKVTIAGSGDVETMNVVGKMLHVTIAGSGNYRAAGSVDKLNLDMVGSGTADMTALKAGTAAVSIAGSGSSSFASDGAVKADIIGSGKVRIHGKAQCTVNKAGSGTVDCQP